MGSDISSYTITMIGGDYRHSLLYRSFVEKGYSVSGIALQNNASHRGSKQKSQPVSAPLLPSDIWIAGIPFTKDNVHLYSENKNYLITLEYFFQHLKKHPPKLLIGGHFSEVALDYARSYQIPCHDLLKCNTISIANAIPTAEGAIYYAIKESPYVLHKSPCLILGFGKCGKALADKLRGLNAQVTICARKEDDLAYAESLGYDTLTFENLNAHLGRFLFLFNTVPAPVLGPKRLAHCSRECVILDLASLPGGVDFKSAQKQHLHALHCLGLPGALSPQTAADILAKQIIVLLQAL